MYQILAIQIRVEEMLCVFLRKEDHFVSAQKVLFRTQVLKSSVLDLTLVIPAHVDPAQHAQPTEMVTPSADVCQDWFPSQIQLQAVDRSALWTQIVNMDMCVDNRDVLRDQTHVSPAHVVPAPLAHQTMMVTQYVDVCLDLCPNLTLSQDVVPNVSLILIVSMGSFVLNKNVSRSLTHVNPTHVEQEQCHVYKETRVNVSVLQEL